MGPSPESFIATAWAGVRRRMQFDFISEEAQEMQLVKDPYVDTQSTVASKRASTLSAHAKHLYRCKATLCIHIHDLAFDFRFLLSPFAFAGRADFKVASVSSTPSRSSPPAASHSMCSGVCLLRRRPMLIL